MERDGSQLNYFYFMEFLPVLTKEADDSGKVEFFIHLSY